MADTDATPMTDADMTAAPDAHHADPRKGAVDTGSGYADGGRPSNADDAGMIQAKAAEAKEAIKDGASKYGAIATDKVRSLADTGKAKAGTSLNQVSKLIDDAASQVDQRLGTEYGNYARNAASQISAFSNQIEQKDVEELIDDARAFVRKSPAVAIGVAAAVGFALARVVQSGIDQADSGATNSGSKA